MLVVLLVLATNLSDSRNYQRLQDSVVSIYEDRLVIKEQLFDLHQCLDEKEEALLMNDTAFFTSSIARRSSTIIKNAVNKLHDAKHSKEEGVLVREFDNRLDRYFELEDTDDPATLFEYETKKSLLKALEDLNHKLFELSKIQVDEGHEEMLAATASMDSINFFTRMETIALIVIGVLVQIAILFNPKRKRSEEDFG